MRYVLDFIVVLYFHEDNEIRRKSYQVVGRIKINKWMNE